MEGGEEGDWDWLGLLLFELGCLWIEWKREEKRKKKLETCRDSGG